MFMLIGLLLLLGILGYIEADLKTLGLESFVAGLLIATIMWMFGITELMDISFGYLFVNCWGLACVGIGIGRVAALLYWLDWRKDYSADYWADSWDSED